MDAETRRSDMRYIVHKIVHIKLVLVNSDIEYYARYVRYQGTSYFRSTF